MCNVRWLIVWGGRGGGGVDFGWRSSCSIWTNKALAKRGHIVASILCPAILPVCGKPRQHCCTPRGHKKCFWRFPETSFVSRTQNLCRAQMLRAWQNEPAPNGRGNVILQEWPTNIWPQLQLNPFNSKFKKVHSPNRLKRKCIIEVVRIGSIIWIIYENPSSWYCVMSVIFLVRLQGKLDIDHSWGLHSPRQCRGRRFWWCCRRRPPPSWPPWPLLSRSSGFWWCTSVWDRNVNTS